MWNYWFLDILNLETLSSVKPKFKCLLPVLPSPTVFSFCHLNALAVWEWKFLGQQPEVTSETKLKAKFFSVGGEKTWLLMWGYISDWGPKNVISTLQRIPSALAGLCFLEARSFQKMILLPSSWQKLDLSSSTQRRALLRHWKHLKLHLGLYAETSNRATASELHWASKSAWAALKQAYIRPYGTLYSRRLRLAFIDPWALVCAVSSGFPSLQASSF